MDFTKDLSGPCRIRMAVFVSIAKRSARLFALARIGTPVEIASSLPRIRSNGNLVRRLDQSRDPDPPRSQMMSSSWLTILLVHCSSISDRLLVRFACGRSSGKRPVRVTLTKAMSTNLISSGTTARQKVNLRTPDVMAAVQQQVESHYRSDIIEKVRRAGGIFRRRYDSASGEAVRFLLRRRARDRSGIRRGARFSTIGACSLWEKLFITRRSIIKSPR